MRKQSLVLPAVLLCYALVGCTDAPAAQAPSAAAPPAVSESAPAPAPDAEATQPPVAASDAAAASGAVLTVQFDFNRAGTPASNQVAIWAENTQGKLIKTLYVTDFTANGGCAFRAEALPTWVAAANPIDMSSTVLDAVAGATPQNSTQTYTWDGTDETGNEVPAGEYNLFVEGTMYWTSSVLYTGSFTWGGESADLELTPVYTEPETATNQNMLEQVTSAYTAGN